MHIEKIRLLISGFFYLFFVDITMQINACNTQADTKKQSCKKVQDMPSLIFALLNKAMAVEECDATEV